MNHLKGKALWALLVWVALFPRMALAEQREFNMTIEEMVEKVAPDLDYHVFAFDGQVPGPLIHVKQGDDLVINVTNDHVGLPSPMMMKDTWGWKVG